MKKEGTIQYDYRTWGNSCTSVFPNNRAWEQQQKRNKKETDEDGKKRGVSMERSKAGTNKRSPNGLTHPNQNTIIINKIWYYFIRNGKGIMKFN